MSLQISIQNGIRVFRFRFRPLTIPPSDDGLFARDSVIRRVYCDASVGLGAGRALLLQLAHPAVAAGVRDHSNYEERPLSRLVGTLCAANTVVFGSRAQAAAIGAGVTRVHRRVVGPGYRAMDPELLCWVNATLADTAIELYQRMVRPLTIDELDQFAADSRRVGEVFGCPLEAQPANWKEFRAYWNLMIDSIEVSESARRIAASLRSGAGLPAWPLWYPALVATRVLTAALLPPRIRDAFEMQWNAADRALAAMMLGGAGMVLPRMPERWRQLGPEFLMVPEQRSAPA